MEVLNPIVYSIRDFFKSHIGEALVYTFITTGGSLMPVWGGLLLYELLSIDNNIWVFVDAGQFYIYSAALFTPSCYLLYRTKNPNNVFHSIVFLLSIFLLLASAILFAGISIFDVSNEPIVNEKGSFVLNLDFLRLSSLILFLFSLFIGLISQAIEYKVRSGGPDVSEVSDTRDINYQDLAEDFDNIKDDE